MPEDISVMQGYIISLLSCLRMYTTWHQHSTSIDVALLNNFNNNVDIVVTKPKKNGCKVWNILLNQYSVISIQIGITL